MKASIVNSFMPRIGRGQSGTGIYHVMLRVINRYGIDELSAWVEMPLPGDVDCIDMENKRIVADETIRQIILEKSGTKSLTEFRLHSKERQKDIVRDVMLKLDAGPRQLSRVSGLPYSIVYKLKKL